MFAIYTPGGRTFSGTLEQLRKVEKSSAGAKSRDVHQESYGFPSAERGMLVTKDVAVSNRSLQEYHGVLAGSNQPEPVIHACQIMTTPVIAIQSNWSIAKVKELLQVYHYQAFPIINNRQQMIGMLSRRLFYELLINRSETGQYSTATVKNTYLDQAPQTYAAEAVTDIRRISTLLVEKQMDAMPVVDTSGEVLGVVSRTDILRCTTNNPPLSLWC